VFISNVVKEIGIKAIKNEQFVLQMFFYMMLPFHIIKFDI